MDFKDFISGNAGLSGSGVGRAQPARSSLPDMPILDHLDKKTI